MRLDSHISFASKQDYADGSSIRPSQEEALRLGTWTMVPFSATAMFSSKLLPLFTAAALEADRQEKEVASCQAAPTGACNLVHRLLSSELPVRRGRDNLSLTIAESRRTPLHLWCFLRLLSRHPPRFPLAFSRHLVSRGLQLNGFHSH